MLGAPGQKLLTIPRPIPCKGPDKGKPRKSSRKNLQTEARCKNEATLKRKGQRRSEEQDKKSSVWVQGGRQLIGDFAIISRSDKGKKGGEIENYEIGQK